MKKKKYATQLGYLRAKNTPTQLDDKLNEKLMALVQKMKEEFEAERVARLNDPNYVNPEEGLTVLCGPLTKKPSTPYYKGKEKS